MSDIESVSLRIFQELAALVVEMDGKIPLRGEKIPADQDAVGKEAAIHWLKTGRRPTSHHQLFAIYPRFWFANMFLQNALIHEKRVPFLLGRPTAIPAALMLEVWEASGRAHWESPKKDFQWGG